LEIIECLGLYGGSYMVGWMVWFDIVFEGVSKVYGLCVVVEVLGIDVVDVLVVGDGCNDLEMFEWVGCSVVMG